ncbi:hypothetical protein SteCoe_10537 [Stentor coeruleus]|uniref:Uncharacterized protein n=1 Tax=Stentor coeruleus TaxID=5963 RepID=A0A1R2CFC0_9CILI|nr:hypothetical protein SteCoe_10537 [Stentor coeruleus]
MDPIFEKPIYSSKSYKRLLIDNYFNTHRTSLIEKVENPSKFSESGKLEKYETMSHSYSTHSLSAIRVSGKNSSPESRPNSVCGSQSMTALTSTFFDSEISNDYCVAIRNITTKSVQFWQRAPKDDNSQCLINSFLLLLEQNITKVDLSSGMKSMKTIVWPTFDQFLYKPGFLIQVIRNLPKSIRAKSILENDVKKSLGLFNMVDICKLGMYKSLYIFIKESLNYISECYNLPILLKKTRNTRTAVPRQIQYRPIKKARTNSGQFDSFVHEAHMEKNPNSSRKILNDRSSSALEHTSDDSPQGNIKGLSSSQKLIFDEVLKKSMNLKTSLAGQNSKNKISSQGSKAQKFLSDSRVNKRIQEKFIKFLQGKTTVDESEGNDKEKITKKLVEEFVKTLNSTEMSEGTASFIGYFVQTKEFDRCTKGLLPKSL